MTRLDLPRLIVYGAVAFAIALVADVAAHEVSAWLHGVASLMTRGAP